MTKQEHYINFLGFIKSKQSELSDDDIPKYLRVVEINNVKTFIDDELRNLGYIKSMQRTLLNRKIIHLTKITKKGLDFLNNSVQRR